MSSIHLYLLQKLLQEVYYKSVKGLRKNSGCSVGIFLKNKIVTRVVDVYCTLS